MEDEKTGVPAHDLEAHNEELRRLDQIRQRLRELRNTGNDMLAAKAKEIPLSATFDFPCLLDDKLHIAYTAWLSGSLTHLPAIEEITRRAASGISLKELSGCKRPIEASGKLLQMLATSRRYALSRSSFLCWYALIRELFSASEPDWSTGSEESLKALTPQR